MQALRFKHNKDNLFTNNKNVRIFVQNLSKMIVANISDFRKDIKSYFNKVAKNFDTLIVNRGKEESVVVMSLDEYNALMATNHELSSRLNEKRLDTAIEKLRKGSSFSKTLLED